VEVIGEEAAHEEFKGEIIDPSDIVVVVGGLSGKQTFEDEVLDGEGDGVLPFSGGGGGGITGKTACEVTEDGSLEGFSGGGG
jgi:hypothetical protein